MNADDGWGWLEQVAGPAIVIAGVVTVLARFVVPVAYLALRRKTNAAEAAGVAPARSRAAQATLANILDRMDDGPPMTESLRRLVLRDRVTLSAGVLAELADPHDRLAFIWFVRPSQDADYARSPLFTGLPQADRDAVVLLDLRRSLLLRGERATLTADSGFYHHDIETILDAARRTDNPDLVAALTSARSDGRSIREGALLPLVDDARTWARLLTPTA